MYNYFPRITKQLEIDHVWTAGDGMTTCDTLYCLYLEDYWEKKNLFHLIKSDENKLQFLCDSLCSLYVLCQNLKIKNISDKDLHGFHILYWYINTAYQLI